MGYHKLRSMKSGTLRQFDSRVRTVCWWRAVLVKRSFLSK